MSTAAPETEAVEAATITVDLAATSLLRTDAGNAERFVSLFGDLVRFDHARKRWLDWDSHRWRPDDDAAITRKAIYSIRRYRRAALEALDAMPDTADMTPEQNAERARLSMLIAWSIKSESKQRLDAMLSLAATMKPVADNGQRWDSSPWLLGVPNGVVDLRTGELRDGRPEDRITMQTAVEYNPDATCPRWLDFLQEALTVYPGNEAQFGEMLVGAAEGERTVAFMKRLAGYSATGLPLEHLIAFLMGVGGNGKGTYLKYLKRALGEYALEVEPTVIKTVKLDRHSTEVADLELRRFVTCEEVGDAKLAADRLKHLSGDSPVRARRMRQDSREFASTWMLWLTTNGQPKTDDNTWAFWRRVLVINFPNSFTHADDPKLDETLEAELPGILRWVVEGAVEYARDGLGERPAAIDAATADYREATDPLERIFEAEVLIEADVSVRTPTADLIAAYVAWAEATHLKGRLTEDAFSKALAGRFQKCRIGPRGKDVRGFKGVAVGEVPDATDSSAPGWAGRLRD